MRRILTAGCTAALLAVTTLTGAAPAGAANQTSRTDPREDVDLVSGNLPSPAQWRSTDLVRTTVSAAPRRVALTVRTRATVGAVRARRDVLSMRVTAGSPVRVLTRRRGGGAWTVVVKARRATRCAGARVRENRARRQLRVTVPRRCLPGARAGGRLLVDSVQWERRFRPRTRGPRLVDAVGLYQVIDLP